jgi:hypothetical protein
MQYRHQWGEHLLGKALMKVREQIRGRLNEFEEEGRADWDLPEEMDAPLECLKPHVVLPISPLHVHESKRQLALRLASAR